jgi:hypothetical protein
MARRAEAEARHDHPAGEHAMATGGVADAPTSEGHQCGARVQLPGGGATRVARDLLDGVVTLDVALHTPRAEKTSSRVLAAENGAGAVEHVSAREVRRSAGEVEHGGAHELGLDVCLPPASSLDVGVHVEQREE